MAQYYDQFEGSYGDESGHPEAWFKAALKAAPDDLPTRRLAANWALEHGKLAFAKEQAENALRIEAADFGGIPPDKRKYSGSTVGHSLRGLVALWEKDWAEAEKNFQKVLDDSPMDVAAVNNMALALVEQDDPAKRQRALDYAGYNYYYRRNQPRLLFDHGLGLLPARPVRSGPRVARRGDQGESRQRWTNPIRTLIWSASFTAAARTAPIRTPTWPTSFTIADRIGKRGSCSRTFSGGTSGPS